MAYTFQDIKSFLEENVGCDEGEIIESCDIVKDLGCYGEDFDELMSAYSKKFHVDMTSYLWYFHTKEEGNSFGGMVFKAPNERVKRIPVTPIVLVDSANNGKWIISYPEHTLPKKRFDLTINLILVIAFFSFWIYKCSK